MEPQVINYIAQRRINNIVTTPTDSPSFQDSEVRAVQKAAENLSANRVPHTLYRGHLAVGSGSGRNTIYVTDGNTCTCEAYTLGEGRPCWHRAAHYLITKVNAVECILAN